MRVQDAFAGLTPREQRYAYHLSQASWHGSLAVLHQTSPESPLIFHLLQRVLGAQPTAELREAARAAGVADADIDHFFLYAAGFYSNMGNYKSFGDTKIIPGCTPEAFASIVRASRSWNSLADVGVFAGRSTTLQQLWELTRGPLYSLLPRERQMGLGADKGISTYYSYNCTEQDARLVQDFMDAKGISPYNTRLFKRGANDYELRLASSLVGSGDDAAAAWLGAHTHAGATITVTRGDYAPIMNRVIDELALARTAVANKTEEEMLNQYVFCACGVSLTPCLSATLTASASAALRCTRTARAPGSATATPPLRRTLASSSRTATRTACAASLRALSPSSTRSCRSASRRSSTRRPPSSRASRGRRPLKRTRSCAPTLRRSRSSLTAARASPRASTSPTTTTFASVRPNSVFLACSGLFFLAEGFKNVSLGNVLRARASNKPVPFIPDAAQAVYAARHELSFEVQVALHELLGHGSGKLLQQNADGSFNFDRSLIDPLTGKPVAKWYAPNETYDVKFGAFSSAYEECRAEAVGIYLSLEKDVLDLFGAATDAEKEEVVFVNWLSMARAGLAGLEFYTPETKAWRQAHMQARYVILRVMLEAGEGFVRIVRSEDKDGPNCFIEMDRTKVRKQLYKRQC